MTQAPPNSPPPARVDLARRKRRVLAVHERAGECRLLAAEFNGSCRILLSRPGRLDEVRAVAKQTRATHVVHVVPGSRSLARAGTIPAGPEAPTLAALSLQSEALLPESVPAHRRGAGVVPGIGDDPRAALVTAWVGPSPDPIELPIAQTWCAEPAALAMLLTGPGLVAFADPASGGISIVAASRIGLVARTLVEDASSPRGWSQAMGAAIDDAARAAGLDGRQPTLPPADTGSPTLVLLDADPLAGVEGSGIDAEWLSEYGVALGAARACWGDAITSPLAHLAPDPIDLRESFGVRATRWLLDRRRVWLRVAACVAVLVLAPLGTAAARYAILNAKASRLADAKIRLEEDGRRAALYRHLEQARWPMTKLLADLSASTPEGITLDVLRIAAPDGITIQGKARTPEMVTTLQSNLGSAGIFADVRADRVEASESGVEFSLSTRVVSPHTPARAADDFAARPLVERMYGVGATSAPDDASSASDDPRTPGAERASRFDEVREAGRRPAPDRGAPKEAPGEISDAEIAALDRAGAMKAWAQRKSALPSAPPDVKERLNAEIAKLQARMDETKGGG